MSRMRMGQATTGGNRKRRREGEGFGPASPRLRRDLRGDGICHIRKARTYGINPRITYEHYVRAYISCVECGYSSEVFWKVILKV